MTSPKYLIVLLASVLVAGCGGESDVERYIKDPGVKGSKPAPLPEVKKFPIADYDRENIKNPFTAKLVIISAGPDVPGSPDMARPRQPLESYPLDTLRINGYLVQNNKPYALVLDTDKEVHRVTVGNYLGQDYGKVVAITREGVKVVESIQDNTGSWTERVVTLPFVEKDAMTSTSGGKPAGAR